MVSLSYLYTFLQSNFLEVPIFLGFYWVALKQANIRVPQSVYLITLANLVTHPIVFFVIMPLKISYLANILIAETFAILGEVVLHHWAFKVSWKRALVASSLANLFSWQLAPLLTYLIFY